MTTRLLLVEFLNDDPLNQHRTELFPFFLGLVRTRGGVGRWSCVFAGQASRPDDPFEVALQGEAQEALLGEVSEFGPTHIVFNEKLSPSTAAAVRDAYTGIELFHGPSRLLGETDAPWVATSLGLASPPGAGQEEPREDRKINRQSLLSDVAPDYESYLLVPPPVGSAPHTVPIIANDRCVYRRGLRRNPHFDGIDVRGLEYAEGCSFCTHTSGDDADTIMSGDELVTTVLAQMEAYDRTVRSERRSNRFMLLSGRLIQKLEGFFAGLMQLNLPPSQLFFTCRVDEFLRAEQIIRETLPLLAARGHSFHLWQMGLENYSEEENQRFNKGISSSMVAHVITLTADLEASWPEAFFFRAHGGFGTIIFTPWTRLADLDANLRGAARCGGGTMLTSRLQLRDGTPLAPLARRDGLCVERFDLEGVPRSTTCITNFGEHELQWRFRHAPVALIYAVMTYLFPRGRAQPRRSNELHSTRISNADLEVFRRAMGDVTTPEVVMRALVDASLDQGDDASTEAVLARSLASLPAAKEARHLLRIEVRERGTETAPCELWVFAHHQGVKSFHRVGRLCLSHRGEHLPAPLMPFVKTVQALMGRFQAALPSLRTLPVWKSSILKVLEHRGLSHRFIWTIDYSDGGSL